VASVAEEVRHLPGHSYHILSGGGHFPCLQLVYLAVDQAHQGKGIGISMAGAVTELFADIGPRIGLPHLILVPINDDVIPFYEGLGFTCYLGGARMFLPLQSALEAMATPPAENGDLAISPGK
jgi:GNAT superfamily N-acetyltransferase